MDTPAGFGGTRNQHGKQGSSKENEQQKSEQGRRQMLVEEEEEQDESRPPMNIILFYADDWRHDVSFVSIFRFLCKVLFVQLTLVPFLRHWERPAIP